MGVRVTVGVSEGVTVGVGEGVGVWLAVGAGVWVEVVVGVFVKMGVGLEPEGLQADSNMLRIKIKQVCGGIRCMGSFLGSS